MEEIAQLIGLSAGELTQLLILATVLVIGLVVMRIFLKVTASFLRMGCLGIILLVAAVYVFQLVAP